MTGVEGWMVNIAIAITGVIGTYAVLRNRVGRLEKDFNEHKSDSQTDKADLDRKLDVQFKKHDRSQERITILEQNTATHLDMEKAEERFVSKKELELHLKNIELTAKNTSHTVEKIEGKLEDVIELLSQSIRNA